ncbi:unnamed product [Ostreococcus tauri]|uniref:Unnamed product n=1 Tax=Ostreococcus tauri TaxID=70448 RepID=A0A090M4D1_OSTTA|nr:unnamed product [Ostreococcus tauri]CEF99056.1 unnamed product [Ostreococcus tauri]|eukprot:XP_022839622.1 unnamed product [Ostreococcus tauri]
MASSSSETKALLDGGGGGGGDATRMSGRGATSRGTAEERGRRETYGAAGDGVVRETSTRRTRRRWRDATRWMAAVSATLACVSLASRTRRGRGVDDVARVDVLGAGRARMRVAVETESTTSALGCGVTDVSCWTRALKEPRKQYKSAVGKITGVKRQINDMTAAASKTQEIVNALQRIPKEIDEMTTEVETTFNGVVDKVRGFVDDVTNGLLPSDADALVKSVSGSIVSGQSANLGDSRLGRRAGLTDSLDYDVLRAQLHGIFFPTKSPLDDANLGLGVPTIDKSQLTQLLNSAKACVSELATEIMNNVPKLNVTATLPQVYLPQFDISFPDWGSKVPQMPWNGPDPAWQLPEWQFKGPSFNISLPNEWGSSPKCGDKCGKGWNWPGLPNYDPSFDIGMNIPGVAGYDPKFPTFLNTSSVGFGWNFDLPSLPTLRSTPSMWDIPNMSLSQQMDLAINKCGSKENRPCILLHLSGKARLDYLTDELPKGTLFCYNIPIDEVFKPDLLNVEYKMPWPSKMGDSPWAPATLKAGFPVARWEACAGLLVFDIPKALATDLLNVLRSFFKTVFDEIKQDALGAVNDIKAEIMVPVNEAANLAASAKVVATKVKGEVDDLINSVKSISGKRRRLLSKSDVTIHEDALHEATSTLLDSHYRSITTVLSHASEIYDTRMRELEKKVMRSLESTRVALIEDPLLLKASTRSELERSAAALGGNPLLDASKKASAALDTAMQAIKDSHVKVGVQAGMKLQFRLDAKANAFKSGDLLDLVDGKFPNPYQTRHNVMLGFGFYLDVLVSAKLSLPYFARLDAQAVLEWTLKVDELEYAIELVDGKVNIITKEPRLKLERYGAASIAVDMQVGLILEIAHVDVKLCFAGVACSGPESAMTQGVYAGLDMFAAVAVGNPVDFEGTTSLSAYFSDFEYSKECTLGEKSTFATGIGAYFEVPKTEAKVDIVTSVLSDDLQLEPVHTLKLIDTTGGVFARGEIFPMQCFVK